MRKQYGNLGTRAGYVEDGWIGGKYLGGKLTGLAVGNWEFDIEALRAAVKGEEVKSESNGRPAKRVKREEEVNEEGDEEKRRVVVQRWRFGFVSMPGGVVGDCADEL